MSGLPPLTPLVNGTPADASQVDGNFDTLATFVDAELINRDGSVAMTEELTLSSSTPSGDLVAASKGYADLAGRGVMGYAQKTTDLNIGAGGTIDIGVSVTFTAVAGRRYRVIYQAPNDDSIAISKLMLREGSTELARASIAHPANGYPVPAVYISNASISGSKTWKLSAVVSGSADSNWDMDSVAIAYLLVEDIGVL